MSGLKGKEVVLDNGWTGEGGALQQIGQFTSNYVSNQTKDSNQNAFYDVKQRMDRVLAVASLVTGSVDQRIASRAYKDTDIKNDSYLKEIGYNSTDSFNASVESELRNTQFHSVQSGASGYQMDGNTIRTPFLSKEKMSGIASTGTFQVGEVTYSAKLRSDGTADLCKPSTAFDGVQGIQIDIDPTASLKATMSATVDPSSFDNATKAQIDSGNYTVKRGDVNYTVTKNESGAYDVSATAVRGSSQYNAMLADVNAPFKSVEYRMNGTASLNQAVTACRNNGQYNLGGMTFSATSGLDSFRQAYDRANNEIANTAKRDAQSGLTRKNRDEAISDIKARGTEYIRKQSDYLSTHFKGTVESSLICQGEIKRQIAVAKAKGDTKLVESLQKQSKLLSEWRKHGGKSNDPTRNSRGRQGKMILANAVLGSDAMHGIRTTVGVATATMSIYHATAGTMRKITYGSSTFANKITSGALKAVGAKDNIVAKNLDRIQGKKTDRYMDKKAKDRARRNGTMKQYRRNKRDQRWVNHGSKLDKRIDALKNKNAKNGQIERLERRRKRFSKVSQFRKNVLIAPATAKAWAKGKIMSTRPMQGISRLKLRVKNSKVGKFTGKVGKILKSPGKLIDGILNIGNIIKRFLTKIVLTVIGSYIALYVAILAPIAIAYLFTRIFSTDAIASAIQNMDFKTEWEKKINGSVNWSQLIVDTVDEDIASDFVLIAQVDATNHFLSKKQIPSEKYPWYKSPNFGEIGKMWAWEEADNFSRYVKDEYDEDDAPEVTWVENGKEYSGKAGTYDNIGRLIGDGKYMYYDSGDENAADSDYYVPQEERQELDSVSFNLIPIIAMSHVRYSDEFSLEEWTSVLGYTYYMFSVSHDVAKYDTNATYQRTELYGDDSFDPGYDYIKTPDCAESALYTNEFSAENVWNPDTHEFTRPNEMCTNVYVHDFSPQGFKSAIKSDVKYKYYKNHWVDTSTGLKKSEVPSYSLASGDSNVMDLWGNLENFFTRVFRGAQRTAKGLISETAKNLLKGQITAENFSNLDVDIWDKGYTDMNDLLTIALRKNSLKGIMKDGTSAHADIEMTIKDISARHNFLLDIQPSKSGVFLWDGTQDSLPHAQAIGTEELEADLIGYGDTCDNYLETPYGKPVDSYLNREEDLLQKGDAGYVEGCHTHKLECHRLICSKEECATTYNDDGSVDQEGHTHGVSCYATNEPPVCGHNHKEWHSKEDPGCWKTICICKGHCGGHIQPQINIVQKVTWKGLAEDDNFKTTHWLTVEEVTSSGGMLTGGVYGLLDALLEDHVATVAQFRAYWYGKCNVWFSPMPRSLYGFAKKVTLSYIMTYVRVIDGATEFIDTLFHGGFKIKCGLRNGDMDENGHVHYHTIDCWKDPKTYEVSDSYEVNPDEGDVESWDGWWDTEGEFIWSYYDEASWMIGYWEEDRYANAQGNWEDVGEASIIWPKTGLCPTTLSAEEIEQILADLELDDSDVSELRKKIIELALSYVGKFKYGQGGHGSLWNGRSSGTDDCSGFVSGILKLAGKNIGLVTTGGLASRSGRGGTLKPGMIVTRYGYGGKSNHTMIYLGRGSDGRPMVVDCSSDKGGVSVRSVSEAYLREYSYILNPDNL